MTATKIEWTDFSWNPIRAERLDAAGKHIGPSARIGWFCVHVSPGCINCYSETMNRRLGTGIDYKAQNAGQVKVFLDEKMLLAPLKWKKPRKVFVCSMTDLFADFVTDEMIDQVFAVMALCPHLTFQVLTKRPERMREYCSNAQTPFRVAKAMAALRNKPSGPEELRPIEGFPDYFVSSHGHIYSDMRGPRRRLRPLAGDQGHLRVTLYHKGASHCGERFLVHRLVLEAFVGPAPSDDAQGRHLDGNPGNNALNNLEWGGQDENWDDSKAHGSHRRYSKLTETQAAAIRERHARGETGEALAREFGVSATQIRNIASGRQWAVVAPIQWPIINIWKGTSVEDQQRADERIPHLLATPAAVRFLSVEPLLGEIDIASPYTMESFRRALQEDVDRGRVLAAASGDDALPGIHWVICGGESGPRARPMHPDWAKSLRNQCADAGVPFFFKQWGEHSWAERVEGDPSTLTAYRAGKEASGRLLDGVEHNGFPA